MQLLHENQAHSNHVFQQKKKVETLSCVESATTETQKETDDVQRFILFSCCNFNTLKNINFFFFLKNMVETCKEISC